MEMIAQEDSSKLKSLLPRGAVSRVAKKHNVSTSFVSLVLNGNNFNENILADLIREAEERKATINNLNERISKL